MYLPAFIQSWFHPSEIVSVCHQEDENLHQPSKSYWGLCRKLKLQSRPGGKIKRLSPSTVVGVLPNVCVSHHRSNRIPSNSSLLSLNQCLTSLWCRVTERALYRPPISLQCRNKDRGFGLDWKHQSPAGWKRGSEVQAVGSWTIMQFLLVWCSAVKQLLLWDQSAFFVHACMKWTHFSDVKTSWEKTFNGQHWQRWSATHHYFLKRILL